jgi:hypothetical protein
VTWSALLRILGEAEAEAETEAGAASASVPARRGCSSVVRRARHLASRSPISAPVSACAPIQMSPACAMFDWAEFPGGEHSVSL